MAQFVFKVKIEPLDKQIALQIKSGDNVQQALDRVISTPGLEVNTADYGLFHPTGENKGQWMDPAQPISTYNVKDTEVCIYKKRFRPLKVTLVDQSEKTSIIDEAMSVADIVKELASKFSLANPEALSLCVVDKTGKRSWLRSHSSLPEQGVLPESHMMLKTKLFVKELADKEDLSNPVALHLAYTELRDSVLAGEHPLSKDEAIQFGALIAQITYGTHTKELEKKSGIKMVDVLPAEFVKAKNVEKDLYKAHASLENLGKTQAQERFVKLVRALKSYGFTFFTISEEQPVKGKKIPTILLGVSENCITKVQQETQTVMKTYPIEYLKKWSSSGAQFAMDFGDYAEGRVNVYTEEGDAIDALVSGYKDLFLRKKQQQGRIGNSETPMQAVASTSGISLPQGATPVLGAQVQLVIKQAMAAASSALDMCDMLSQMSVPTTDISSAKLTARLDTVRLNRMQLRSAIHTMSPAVASLLNQVLVVNAVGQLDIKTVVDVLKKLSEQTPLVASSVKNIYENSDPSVIDESASQALVQSATSHVASINDYLSACNNAIHVLAVSPLTAGLKDSVLTSADAMGDTACQTLSYACAQEVDDLKQGDLVERAMEILELVEGVTGSVQAAAQEQNVSVHDVRFCCDQLNFGAKLVSTCARVIGPAMLKEQAQAQLAFSTKILQSTTGTMLTTLGRVNLSTTEVNQQLATVLEKMNEMTTYVKEMVELVDKGWVIQFKQAVDPVTEATAQMGIGASHGDRSKVITSTKIVAEATQNLITLARASSGCEPDPLLQQSLSVVIRSIAEAMTKVVRAATAVAKNPADVEACKTLLSCTTHLNCETARLVADTQRKLAYKQLVGAARNACDMINITVQEGKNVAPYNTNAPSQTAINTANIEAQAAAAALIEAVKNMESKPQDTGRQMELLATAKAFIPSGARLLQAVHPAAPHISDRTAQLNFATSAKNSAAALQLLSNSVKTAAEASGSIEIEAAIGSVDAMVAEVDDLLKVVLVSPMELQTAFDPHQVAVEFTMAIKTVAAAVLALIALAKGEDKKQMGNGCKKLASAYSGLVRDVKAACSTTTRAPLQQGLLQGLRVAGVNVSSLINVCRQVEAAPADPRNESNLDFANKEITDKLNHLVTLLPVVKTCDDVISALKEVSKDLSVATLPTADKTKSFTSFINDVNACSRDLATAVASCVSKARGSPDALIDVVSQIDQGMTTLMNKVSEAAAACGDVASQQAAIDAFQASSATLVTLLGTIKQVTLDVKNVDLQKKLGVVAKAVTQNLNNLMKAVKVASPAIRDVEDSAARLSQVEKMFGSPPDVPSGSSYHTIAESCFKNSAALKALSPSVLAAIEVAGEDVEPLGAAVKAYSNACAALASTASLAALLAGGVAPGPRKAKYERYQSDLVAAADAVKASKDPRQAISAVQSLGELSNRLVADTKTSANLEPESFGLEIKPILQAFTDSLTLLVQSTKAYAVKPREAEPRAKLEAVAEETKTKGLAILSFIKTKLTEPAQTKELANAQGAIVQAVLGVISSTVSVVDQARTAAEKPKEKGSIKAKLELCVRSVDDSLAKFLVMLETNHPGSLELSEALSRCSGSLGDLDTAAINITVGALEADKTLTYGQAQELMLQASKSLVSLIDVLASCPTTSPGALVTHTQDLATALASLTHGGVSAAATTKDKKLQTQVITLAKALAEPATSLVMAGRALAVEPRNITKAAAVSAHKKECEEAAKALTAILRVGVTSTRECEAAIADITAHKKNLLEPLPAASTVADSFSVLSAALSDRSTSLSQVIALCAQTAKTSPDSLGVATSNIAPAILGLVKAARSILAVGMRQDLRDACVAVVDASLETATKAKAVTERPDKEAVDACTKAALCVADKVALLLSALKKAATGARECEAALMTVQSSSAEIETLVVFMDQDTLESDGLYIDHIASLKKQAAAVKAACGVLSTHGSNQEALGKSATSAASEYFSLVSMSKQAVAALTDRTARSRFAGAVKQTGELLSALIKVALAVSTAKSSVAALESSRKEASDQCDSLSELFVSIGDSTIVGIKACEKVADDVSKLVKSFPFAAGSVPNVDPGDCENSAKDLAVVAGKIISATKGAQKQLQLASSELCPSVKRMFETAQGSIHVSESDDEKNKTMTAASSVGDAVLRLMRAIVESGARVSGNDAQNRLRNENRAVTEAIRALITSCDNLRHVDDAGALEAAKELEAAAARISETAEKLAKLKPKPAEKPVEGDEEEMNFEQVIYIACEALARATGALVTSAVSAQKELAASGQNMDQGGSDELIASAKAASDATAKLAEYTNGKEAALISAAKDVSNSTTRLVRAVQTDSAVTKNKLNNANLAVTNATQSLVQSAKAYQEELKAQKETEEEEKRLQMAQSALSEEEKMKMKQQIEMLKLERELARAKKQQAQLSSARQKK